MAGTGCGMVLLRNVRNKLSNQELKTDEIIAVVHV